jgi:leucyl/phenylalanyl-tRNA--protein transferase
MLAILDPDDPKQPFPRIETALEEPKGLLAVGGCLSVERLMNAYRQGIFPWFNEGEPILWWSPDPRWVMRPEEVNCSRSLAKRLKRSQFRFGFDEAFEQVVRACSEPRTSDGGTWITDEMQQAYRQLHRTGAAHSFESWQGDQLVGGLYGVAIGQVFFGESMFHRVTDASKAAFVIGCHALAAWGYRLIDCQVHTSHLESLGAKEISRVEFGESIRMLCDLSVSEKAWKGISWP